MGHVGGGEAWQDPTSSAEAVRWGGAWPAPPSEPSLPVGFYLFSLLPRSGLSYPSSRCWIRGQRCPRRSHWCPHNAPSRRQLKEENVYKYILYKYFGYSWVLKWASFSVRGQDRSEDLLLVPVRVPPLSLFYSPSSTSHTPEREKWIFFSFILYLE